jgi:hypothetical protein
MAQVAAGVTCGGLIAPVASRGFHVLCQKPAALDQAALGGMSAACDADGVRLMIKERNINLYQRRSGSSSAEKTTLGGRVG